MVNNQKYLYEVDGELYDALSLSPGPAMGFITKAIASANRYFKLGATGINTAFGLQNLMSDAHTVAINSKHLDGSKRYTKAAEWAGRVIAHMANAKPNELIELFENEGGDMSSYIGTDKDSIAHARRGMMMPGLAGKLKRVKSRPQDAPAVLGEMFQGAIDAVRSTIAWSDMAPRLAEFEASLNAQGYSVKDGKIVNANGIPEMPTRDAVAGQCSMRLT